MSPTIYELHAREMKAAAMCDLLTLAGVTSTAAAEMSQALRDRVASETGQHKPSEQTWERVVTMLASREMLAARFGPQAPPRDELAAARARRAVR